ncbi:MAG: hypothetical protein JWO52_3473 [Gammaproteobacteria bacterium]|nr:hypothetical protein [Gammaproteobacteria bacterium]
MMLPRLFRRYLPVAQYCAIRRAVAPVVEVMERRYLMSAGMFGSPSVLTWHGDAANTGQNTAETQLTASPNNLGSLKHYTWKLDGAVYAQPLYVSKLGINNLTTPNDAVIVCTENDTVYAIDPNPADGTDASHPKIYWQRSLLNSGEIAIPGRDAYEEPVAGPPAEDIAGSVGITSTPVVDPTTGFLYVLAASEIDGTSGGTVTGNKTFIYRLHAINLHTNSDSEEDIAKTTYSYIPPSGNGPTYALVSYDEGPFTSYAGHPHDTFDAHQEQARTGLTLANGSVYMGFGSYGDRQDVGTNASLWHGWVLGQSIVPNHVIDPGFEAETGSALNSPWSDPFNASQVETGGNSFSGNNDVKVSTGGETLQSITGLTPNTTYVATAWVKATSGDHVTFGVKDYGSTQSTDVYASVYTLETLTFTTDATHTSATLFLHKVVGTGSAWGDDFTIVQQNQTPAWSGVLNVTPGYMTGSTSQSAYGGGVWAAGGKLATDGTNLFVQTGNGDFDPTTQPGDAIPGGANYGSCVLKISLDASSTSNAQNANGWGIKVADWFAPSNAPGLNGADLDLGSGAPTLLPTGINQSHPNMLTVAGKDGKIYLLDQAQFTQNNQHFVSGALGQWTFNVTETNSLAHNGTTYTTTSYDASQPNNALPNPDYISNGSNVDAILFPATNLPTLAPGKFGKALKLDGSSQCAIIPNIERGVASFNISNKITISAWINPANVSANGIQDIVAHGYTGVGVGGQTANAEVFLRMDSGRYELGSWNGVVHEASMAIPSSDQGHWIHLAGTYDGTSWTLYHTDANGVVTTASLQDTVGAVPVNSDWTIGADIGPWQPTYVSSGDYRFYNGLIDDVRIYTRTLSSMELAQVRTGDYNNDSFNQVIQSVQVAVPPEGSPPAIGAFSSAAYFNGSLYYAMYNTNLDSFAFSGGLLPSAPTKSSSATYGFPGSTPSVSSNGTSNGIIWTLNRGTNQLVASIASDVSLTPLLSSATDPLTKFDVPTVIHGRVFFGYDQSTAYNGLGVLDASIGGIDVFSM